MFANESQITVADQRARKKMGFDQNLKSVTNAENGPTGRREFLNRAHYGRKARDGAAAKIIAVRKATRKNQSVVVFQIGFVMPDVLGLGAEVGREGIPGVVIAVAAREDDDCNFHVGISIA